MLSEAQETHLKQYVESSAILSITFPWQYDEKSDNLLIVSRVGGDVFTDVLDAEGRTTVISTDSAPRD